MTVKTKRHLPTLPAVLDAERMVAEQRVFEGELPLAGLSRLVTDLADPAGQVRYRLVFGRSMAGSRELHLQAWAELGLECQRTLETFFYPVVVDTRLGLIDNERQEAGLPEGVEPVMLDEGGLRPAAVIEDELLLAVPLVPVKPGSRLPQQLTDATSDAEDDVVDNPFAVLGKLKQNQ